MNPFNHQLIHHFLERSAERFPNKIALIHDDTRATYAEINTQADQLSQSLIDSGIQTGDRVVILLENSLDYVVSYYGVLKAGAVAVPLSTDLKPDGLNPLLAEIEPAALITGKRFERLLKACDPSLLNQLNYVITPINQSRTEEKKQRSEIGGRGSEDGRRRKEIQRTEKSFPAFQPSSLPASSLAAIIYTSGSTGKPRGVMLSHQNVVSNVQAVIHSLSILPSDIQMVVLPFFYVMGTSLLNTHVAAGATVVINNRFAYPATVLNQMAEEQVTSFSGVPSTYAYLLHRSPLKKYRDRFSSLRYCSQAGGHMSRQIKRELRKALPEHVDIYIMYGATEASARLSCLAAEQFGSRIDSIGKPIAGVGIRVVDPAGKDLPAGTEGELVASGPNIMMGYWRDETSTAAVLDELGYHTGDMGYRDGEGFLYVTGRRDDILKVGGHRINPSEVEDAIMATGMVVEVAVLGVPDELLGHKLTALAVPISPDITDSAIIHQCATKLPRYKLPESLRLVRALPKNSSGKVDRVKCLELT